MKIIFLKKSANRVLLHLLFWCVFFLFYFELRISYSQVKSADIGPIAVIYFYKLVLQMSCAYFLIYFLVPRTLNHNKYLLFALGLIAWAYLIYFLYQVACVTIFEIRFSQLYSSPDEVNMPLIVRMKYLPPILNFTIFVFTPSAVMGLIRFYKNQRTMVQLREEKKSMELKLLRNQLNPHFLFNTLNNLYALALRKDDKAPEAISRLSGILDYMLYGTAQPMVSLEKEIELIENFIALEKLRYDDKRCLVRFKKNLQAPASIPPLILLTLVENAFKHGVVKEGSKAEIDLDLHSRERMIWFRIDNTVPSTVKKSEEGKGMGLLNIRNQLNILYPGKHSIEISHDPERFVVTLALHEA